tara:strand:- start:179 stop:1717 length:1539 start_codon:yes stop_codon:yes gene_type:complete
MATHDYNLANQSGASFRSDLNNCLAAILSNNSNASDPSTTVAFMTFADSNAGKLKIRNSANDGFIDLINLDGTIARDLQLTGASANIVFDQSENALEFADDAKAVFGTGSDLTISHTGGNSIIEDSGTGNLQLKTNGTKVLITTGGGVSIAEFVNNGKCELFHAGSSALVTSTTGVEVKSPSGACEFKITGNEGSAAKIVLQADEGDDNADYWQIAVPSSDNKFGIRSLSTGSLVELFTIDTSGNVGIGNPDPDQKLCVEGSGTTILKVQNSDDGTAQLTLGNTGTSNLNLQQVGGDTKFAIGGNTRMILTEAGRLHIGDSTTQIQTEQRLSIETTNLAIAAFHKSGTGANNILDLRHGRATGSMQGNMIVFRDSGGVNEGAITTSGSTTLFTNNSDYRLKENIVEITNAITRFKQLKPSRFNFKANPDETVDGFLAHEVALIVPEAVVGTKDAVITQALIDSGDAPDGNLGDPIHQQMDMTRIVPLLTAALQESISKIETLETKVAALEAA